MFRYLRDASMPVYILHSPAIVLVAHFVIRTDWSIPVKFAVILVASIALTLSVYEFGIRRLRPLRFLFGMKTTPRSDPSRTAGRTQTDSETIAAGG